MKILFGSLFFPVNQIFKLNFRVKAYTSYQEFSCLKSLPIISLLR